MFNVNPALEFEMFLRDSRMIEVLVSLDRLAVMPNNKVTLDSALSDMNRLKTFINDNLPVHLQNEASEIFSEHALAMKDSYIKNNKA